MRTTLTIGLLILFLMGAVVQAATVVRGPYTIQPGSFGLETVPRVVVTPTNERSLMQWCPDLTVFNLFTQRLQYMFVQCETNGTNCRDWQGGTVLGAMNEANTPHVDQQGTPITCFGGITVTRYRGAPQSVYMRGTLTSDVPVPVTIRFVEE